MSYESGAAFCPICYESFDSEKFVPIVFSCGHNICGMCNENPEYTVEACPMCREPIVTRIKNFGLIETLEMFGNVHKKIEQCSNCQKPTLHENMYTCTDCFDPKDFLNWTPIAEEGISKIVKVSMCANCIVPIHSYKGHKTQSMLSLWSFSSRLLKIRSIFNEFRKSDKLVSKTFSQLKIMSTEVRKIYKVLNFWARINKSTEKQNEMLERLKLFIEESIAILGKAEYEMEKHITGSKHVYRTPVPEPTLKNYEDVSNLLYNTYSRFKDTTVLDIQEYDILLSIALNSESREKQVKEFEKTEKFIRKMKTVMDDVQVMLEGQKNILQNNIRTIEEWRDAEADLLSIEDIKMLQLDALAYYDSLHSD